MFVVDNILISDDLLEAEFSCNLGACRGACCVHGDSGAPLEPSERAELEKVLPIVRNRLRPEALQVIEEAGVWEGTESGGFATTCVDGAECVFVRYDGPVAKCAIQEAHHRGETAFVKPISCHLFPIRVTDLGDFDALNYEEIDICASGRRKGIKERIYLTDYLDIPLTRKYGADWYRKFSDACSERRKLFSDTGRSRPQ